MVDIEVPGGRPRIVLVIGPCGAGKTSALARMRAVLAERVGEVAVLETDTTYTMIDPTWSEYTSRRDSMAKHVAAATAAALIREGCWWVVVGSNGLQDREQVGEFVARLQDCAEVFHIFLDPSVPAVQARIAARAQALDGHKTPGWIAENVAWMRSHHRPAGAVIDNSTLNADQTVEAIYATVVAGRGCIHRPPG